MGAEYRVVAILRGFYARVYRGAQVEERYFRAGGRSADPGGLSIAQAGDNRDFFNSPFGGQIRHESSHWFGRFYQIGHLLAGYASDF